MANFEGFRWVISSSINLLFLKSDIYISYKSQILMFKPIHPHYWHCWRFISRKNAPQKESCKHYSTSVNTLLSWQQGESNFFTVAAAARFSRPAIATASTFNCSRGCCSLASAVLLVSKATSADTRLSVARIGDLSPPWGFLGSSGDHFFLNGKAINLALAGKNFRFWAKLMHKKSIKKV